jgi:hypothetical protein
MGETLFLCRSLRKESLRFFRVGFLFSLFGLCIIAARVLVSYDLDSIIYVPFLY